MEGLPVKDVDHTWTFGVTTLKNRSERHAENSSVSLLKEDKSRRESEKGKRKTKKIDKARESIKTKSELSPSFPDSHSKHGFFWTLGDQDFIGNFCMHNLDLFSCKT